MSAWYVLKYSTKIFIISVGKYEESDDEGKYRTSYGDKI